MGPFPSQLLWKVDAAQPSVFARQHLTNLLRDELRRTGAKNEFNLSTYLMSRLPRILDELRAAKKDIPESRTLIQRKWADDSFHSLLNNVNIKHPSVFGCIIGPQLSSLQDHSDYFIVLTGTAEPASPIILEKFFFQLKLFYCFHRYAIINEDSWASISKNLLWSTGFNSVVRWRTFWSA